jgi:hypothetical protein
LSRVSICPVEFTLARQALRGHFDGRLYVLAMVSTPLGAPQAAGSDYSGIVCHVLPPSAVLRRGAGAALVATSSVMGGRAEQSMRAALVAADLVDSAWLSDVN